MTEERSSKEETEIPLHPIERSLLLFLTSQDAWVEIEDVSKGTGLSLDQIRIGAEWLKSKKFVDLRAEETSYLSLGPEGRYALAEGLPERRLVRFLESSGNKSTFDLASRSLGSEFSVGLGRARKNGWVRIEGSSIKKSPKAESKLPEELFLEKLGTGEKVAVVDLDPEQKQIVSSLIKRHGGLVKESSSKTVKLRLNPKGKEATISINKGEIDEITPEVILGGSWRNKPLRSIDVSSTAPSLYGGRKHPIRLFMEEVKEAFVSLGFAEIEGPMIQSSLWNFDALFIPQQHPTREMVDTFYLSKSTANIAKYGKEMNAIRASHERGEKTGSLGWGYNWSEDEARRVVLRTHTTAVTIKYLSDQKPSEARVFMVGKVFRNEKPNYKHLPEFYQIEGVTVGPKLNIRNLIYIISKFYSKLGFEKVKFWPTYFPYTEPSLQTVVFDEKKKNWMELGGMGVFRPEVTIPLGVENPVLAWGLGMDRLVMLRYNLEDIRDLFGANLGWLRKAGVVT